MEKLYILNSKFDKKDTCSSFLGIENNGLYYVTVEQSKFENKIHRFLKKSFKYCDLNENQNPKDALFKRGKIYSEGKSKKGDYRLIEVSNQPGNYYPRIYRPYLEPTERFSFNDKDKVKKLEKIVLNYPDYNPYDTNLIVSGLNQLAILTDMLSEILSTVYPTQQNLKTFGHNIKNLLVLSCIEVEAQLKGIYKANEISAKRNYTTKDYIKLKDTMQLNRYSVRLPLYPDLKIYSPFKFWSENVGATKSIKWYDNYNAVKHNSETEFSRATLDSAIQAVCAVAVLLHAQYGPDIPYWREEIGSYYEIINNTKWTIEDKILPPMNNDDWHIKKIGL